MLTAVFAIVVLLVVIGVLSCLHPRSLARLTMRLARRLSGMRARSIVVDGWRIAYLDGGSGEPLLLLHGMGADKDNFLLVARALRRHYRVIVPDLPGFGDSERRHAADYGTWTQVERLRALCHALRISRCHLGGNSMGGLIAGAYAARYPQAVSSLWLLAPAGVNAAQPSTLMQAIARSEPLPIFARNVSEVRALLRFAMQKPPPMPGFVLRALAQDQAASYALNQRIVAKMVEGPWLDDLLAGSVDGPATDVPALIVWGDHDRALDCSGAEVLGRLMPRSRVTILSGIGHVPMMEAPQRVVADYLRFQADVRAGRSEKALGSLRS